MTSYTIATLLAFGASQAPDLRQPYAPQIVPSQWAMSCPWNGVGESGRSQCTAEYLAYPRIFVSRANDGMQIVFKTACGLGRNSVGQGVPLYRPISLHVPLKSSDTAETIQRILVLNVRNFPTKIRKVCGESPLKGLKFEVDQSQMPAMIQAVFFPSGAR